MDQVPLATSSTIIPVEHFWYAVQLYHDRPHCINRKLGTVAQVLFCEISIASDSIKRISDIFTREVLLYEIRKLPDLKSVTLHFIKNIANTYDRNVSVTETSIDAFNESLEQVFVSVRVLYGRRDKTKCLEIIIFDKRKKAATFFAVQEYNTVILAPLYPYHIELTQDGNLRILLNSFEDADTSSAEWLASKLFPKLIKWVENPVDSDKVIYSLGLLNSEDYCNTYIDLKEKYGKKLVELWPQKAQTDPQKFVYEDLAIASYLICLWRQLGISNINFIDCGCGNGLLVHVLNQEGYKGCGLDIRSRKLWELFSEDLSVGTVTPSSTFPNATWIIGNHSDELTPWIPVIATKSSLKTNFFVLPCCTYDFSGQKYIRMDTSKSQYNDYINYIERISKICGFHTLIDRLKIPSTRRICLVGIRENCHAGQFDEVNQKIDEFIDSRLKNKHFVAREPAQQVRNCTKLDGALIDKIIQLTMKTLLDQGEFTETKSNGESWNRGGLLPLSAISQIIESKDLKFLKSECGGLQTLFKNKRYIFQVSKGLVCLQKPASLVETTKYKEKPCWFYRNHPDGCLFDNETCAYQH